MLIRASSRRFSKRRLTRPAEESQGGSEVLRAVDVSKSYGGVVALDGVTVSVCRGEVLALVGDNGAGKSTLVKIVSGVVRADKAELYVLGNSVDIGSPAVARSLGIRTVHQEQKLAENLDVIENLFLGEELARWTGPLHMVDFNSMVRPTEVALSKLRITTIADIRTPVARLSGGQRQAVAVARATLGQYRIVLLDEPTTGLSVEASARVMDMVMQLREGGCAVVLVSQSIEEVFEVADRVAVLHHGRLAGVFARAETTPEEVVTAVMGGQL